MSGMSEVLALHQLSIVWENSDGAGITCMCGLDVPTEIERNEIDTQWLAAHQAEALSAAGFGPVKEERAKALEWIADDFSVNLTVMSGPRIRTWITARAAAERDDS